MAPDNKSPWLRLKLRTTCSRKLNRRPMIKFIFWNLSFMSPPAWYSSSPEGWQQHVINNIELAVFRNERSPDLWLRKSLRWTPQMLSYLIGTSFCDVTVYEEWLARLVLPIIILTTFRWHCRRVWGLQIVTFASALPHRPFGTSGISKLQIRYPLMVRLWILLYYQCCPI